jgi:hypothetical protein
MPPAPPSDLEEFRELFRTFELTEMDYHRDGHTDIA